MPYITQLDRQQYNEILNLIDEKFNIHTKSGELNYLITKIIQSYLTNVYTYIGYTQMNEVVGVLECAKQEFYRRVASPYEDEKMKQNGDVYDV